MSVINQMLKDLDQRKHEQLADDQNGHNVVVTSKIVKKMWMRLVLILSILSILSVLIYSGYLLQQNKNLYQIIQQQNRRVEKNKLQEKLNVVRKIARVKAIKSTIEKISQKAPKASVKTKSSQRITSHFSVDNTTKKNLTIQQPNIEKQISKVAALSSVQAKVVVPTKPSMSVSRRKISAKQLATQKMSEAQEAVLTNKLAKAEKLFEEILILTPNNKAARKQLAALWFGRKAFQSALNLLSQGMVLDPNNSEYPLMQARIYLSQGDNKQAYKILKAFEQNNNLDYLSTLANVAQQLKKFTEAAITYKHLTRIQSNQSRWWLGLAIAYDSNSQYVQALSAYKTSISQNKLSKSALVFAQQRIQALKE